MSDGQAAKKPTICVDFDGVIASWDSGTFSKPGLPIPGASEFLYKLSRVGRVVIWTCRTNSKLYDGEPVQMLRNTIEAWLAKWGMDSYVSDVYAGQGKPYAGAYIDDKAIQCDPERLGDEQYALAVAEAARLCCNGKQHPQKGATLPALQAAVDAQ